MTDPHLAQVQAHFNQEAAAYDQLIPRLIPFYNEQHSFLQDFLPPLPANAKALDLGGGTGALTQLLLTHDPQVQVTMLDLAPRMVDICQERFAAFGDRLACRQQDFSSGNLGEGYHLIVSGLAIHHLDDPQKQRLYQDIYAALAPGGVFLNRDVVLGPTPQLRHQYEVLWQKFMTSQGQDADHWFALHQREDRPATLEAQLEWLQHAGFEQVACHWRYANFAIFGGTKPDQSP